MGSFANGTFHPTDPQWHQVILDAAPVITMDRKPPEQPQLHVSWWN
jgi:hypothetical protein